MRWRRKVRQQPKESVTLDDGTVITGPADVIGQLRPANLVRGPSVDGVRAHQVLVMLLEHFRPEVATCPNCESVMELAENDFYLSQGGKAWHCPNPGCRTVVGEAVCLLDHPTAPAGVGRR